MNSLSKVIKRAMLLLALLCLFVGALPVTARAVPIDPPKTTSSASIPEGNQEFQALCDALKKIKADDFWKNNCRLWPTQNKQDSAVSDICQRYGADSDTPKLKDECNAYSKITGRSSTCDPAKQICTDCQTNAGTSGCLKCTGDKCKDPAADPNAKCDENKCDLVAKYINPAINLFSIIFALVVVISLLLGAIQYITSEGDPQKSAKAKQRIFNTIVAFVAYFFLYAFLQFLVPGGIFK
jgi:hypothetical protein